MVIQTAGTVPMVMLHFLATAILSASVGLFFLINHAEWQFPGLFRPITSLAFRFLALLFCILLRKGCFRWFVAVLFQGKGYRFFIGSYPPVDKGGGNVVPPGYDGSVSRFHNFFDYLHFHFRCIFSSCH